MSQIVKRHSNGKPEGAVNIIVTKFMDRVHDVSHGKCMTKEYPTILDLLEIANPNVTNCLIDHKNIEKILLMDHDRQAQNLLSSTHKVPRNCKFAYTGDMNQFYPAPMYRSYAISSRKKGNVLQTSMSDHLAYLESEYQTMKISHDNAKEKKKAHDDNNEMTVSEHKDGIIVCQETQQAITTLSNRLFKLKQVHANDKPPDISALEDDTERIQEDIQEIEKSETKLQVDIKEAKKQFAAIKEQQREFEAELVDEREEIKLRRRLDRFNNRIEENEQEARECDEKLRRENRRKVQEEENLNEANAKLEKMKSDFDTKYGKDKEVKTTRPPNIIRRQLKAIEESFRRKEEIMEPREIVEREYQKINKR